ncbi:MAG: hypothetical protein IJ190_12330 [Prevotella sp.]|nr:hypothetical protein [Prevotella sp.]
MRIIIGIVSTWDDSFVMVTFTMQALLLRGIEIAIYLHAHHRIDTPVAVHVTCAKVIDRVGQHPLVIGGVGLQGQRIQRVVSLYQ